MSLPADLPSHRDVLSFWFVELQPAQWWSKSQAVDDAVRTRFGALHQAAAAGELWHWREPGDDRGEGGIAGRLAEILVLDQFSRHLYRDDPRAFDCDPMALALAQTAIALGLDRHLSPPQRAFLYLPFMHSESLRVHEQALRLFDQPGLEQNLDAERKHLAILQRFGRYPHRNVALGRASTPDEAAFLQTPGSSF